MTDDSGCVFFVGAGPGDPDLLTIAGRKIIEKADLDLYAGSLVPREILACARRDALIVDSSALTLEETHALMLSVAGKGGIVARVHTGDPVLYGAIAEQIRLLDKAGISWRIIPGVTAASAAAAAAGISFTMPGICQSLVITRAAGRTPVPPGQTIEDFARHGAAMALYLSAGHAAEIQQQLAGALAPETPVLCASRVGWPDEKLVWTSVAGLRDCVLENAIERQTVFIVLPGQGKLPSRSCLYDGSFQHMFRK